MPSNSRLRRPTPKADELAERHRPRASLYPESIRRLAVAMVEHALADLERPRWIRGAGRYVPADYRPDPEGAVAWLHRGGDAPLSARWCEQITGVCLDPLRLGCGATAHAEGEGERPHCGATDPGDASGS